MKRFKFPSPFSVLYIIIIVSAIATWVLPAGSFDTLSYDSTQKVFLISGENASSLPANQQTLDSLGLNMELSKFESGKIRRPVSIPNTYLEQDASPQGFKEILFAPIKGIYESIDIILFVFIIGGFIGVFQHSGALDKGVGLLAKRMEGREKWLIISLILLIALGGTTFGMQEETIAFYPILVPIFLAAGYDLIVPVAAVYGGSCIGLMGALINPFGTIIASDAVGVSWTEGIESRIAMLILGALGNVVGVPTEEIVNAYLFGFGLMQFVTPSGLILPSLAMVNVPYNVWLKFIAKLLLPLAILGALILITGYLV